MGTAARFTTDGPIWEVEDTPEGLLVSQSTKDAYLSDDEDVLELENSLLLPWEVLPELVLVLALRAPYRFLQIIDRLDLLQRARQLAAAQDQARRQAQAALRAARQ